MSLPDKKVTTGGEKVGVTAKGVNRVGVRFFGTGGGMFEPAGRVAKARRSVLESERRNTEQ